MSWVVRKRSIWALIGLLALAGCGERPATDTDFVRAADERGPLKLTVTVRPKQVWVGDTVEILVAVHTPEGFDVQLPGADALGELGAQLVDSPEARPAAEGGLDWGREFSVVPFASGQLEVPPVIVEYARKPEEPSAELTFERQLRTEALAIEVQSALTARDNVAQPRDITGTLLPQRTWGELLRAAWLPAVVAVVAIGATILLVRRWRRRRREVPPILPEVWALRALSELEREDWIGTGRGREFYYGLSEIVRAYIEKKFALAAPDMTTEEFLVALARDHSALPYDADRLRLFLEACDIVKYAALSPRREDTQEALGTARVFVQTTAAAAAQRQAATADAVAGGQAA